MVERGMRAIEDTLQEVEFIVVDALNKLELKEVLPLFHVLSERLFAGLTGHTDLICHLTDRLGQTIYPQLRQSRERHWLYKD